MTVIELAGVGVIALVLLLALPLTSSKPAMFRPRHSRRTDGRR